MTAQSHDERAAQGQRGRFMTVAAAAREIGVSEVTIYRAIADSEFPAIRVRGRLVVPVRAIDAMADAALAEHTVVDAAAWVSEPRTGRGA